jgi:hypothetical protein
VSQRVLAELVPKIGTVRHQAGNRFWID